MSISDPYGGTEQAFRRTIDPDGKKWRVTLHKGRTEEVAITALASYLEKIPDKHWLNLIIGHRMTAEELVSQGAGVAATISACFTTLAPIYENRNP
jgi:phosphohistidine phosphatase SixA